MFLRNASKASLSTGLGSEVMAMTRMCCVCNKVEEGGEWRPLHMVTEDKRVTHGYCPECFAETMVQIEDFIGGKAVGSLSAPGWSPRNGLVGPCV